MSHYAYCVFNNICLCIAFWVTRITPGFNLLRQKHIFNCGDCSYSHNASQNIKISDTRTNLWFSSERDHSTAVILLSKQLHFLCITRKRWTNAVSTRVRRYEITEKGDKRGEFETLLWTCFGGDCCVWAASVGFCWRLKLTVLADKPLVGRSVCLCPLSRGHWEEQQKRGEKGL